MAVWKNTPMAISRLIGIIIADFSWFHLDI